MSLENKLRTRICLVVDRREIPCVLSLGGRLAESTELGEDVGGLGNEWSRPLGLRRAEWAGIREVFILSANRRSGVPGFRVEGRAGEGAIEGVGSLCIGDLESLYFLEH